MDVKRFIAYLVFISCIVFSVGCSIIDNDEFLRVKLNIQYQGIGTVIPDPNKQTYLIGEKVTLTAKSEGDWTFDQWQGKFEKSENPITITVENNDPIIAVFTNKNAKFTLDVQEIGAGKVARSPDQENYLNGTKVALTAEAVEGMAFAYWLGDLAGVSENPTTLTMTNDKRVLAVFVPEEINGIQFTDPTIERIVREETNKPTGPITLLDIDSLTELDLSSYLISSLEGLEYLTPLTSLNLSQTGTDDISQLATLHNLEYLDLHTNQIEEIEVISAMLDLIELDLHDNQITDLSPMVWLQDKNLTTLKLGHNNIADISALRFISSLEVLQLEDNMIAEIEPLTDLKSLRELNLGNNQITDFTSICGDLSVIDSLEVLNLSDNQLEDISDLAWMGENSNSHLRELYLAGNQIIELEALYWLKDLEIIDLSANQIIDMGIFITKTNILKLYLNDNQIRNISNLCNLNSLETLHLHNNDIRDIEVLLSLWSLEEVTLMDNPNLNIYPGSRAWDIIQELKGRGVNVHY